MRFRRSTAALALALAISTLTLAPASSSELPESSGGSDALGAPRAALTWHFAEGNTGPGFQVYVTLLNPGDTPADATLAFNFRGGDGVSRLVSIPPRARRTIDVNETVGANRDVALSVRATQPIVAERPIYFNARVGMAGQVDGGHTTTGATATSTTWYFAEGFTGRGFQEYLTLYNPGETQSAVTLTFAKSGTSGANPQTQTAELTIGPRTRETVDVNAAVGVGLEVAIAATATQPLVLERPLYFSTASVGRAGGRATGWVAGGHTVIGATSPSTDWFFAEGYTGPGFQPYYTVFNPNTVPTTATVAFNLTNGSTRTATIEAPAGARRTFDVAAVLGPNVEASARVTSPLPVVAERPTYFVFECAAVCRFSGGHAALGATGPSATWFFAEGFTGRSATSEFRSYVSIQNPGTQPAEVPVTFFLRTGDPKTVTVPVPRTGRATIDIRNVVGDGQEVATRVGPAPVPVVAERSVYFDLGPLNIYQETLAGRLQNEVLDHRELVYVPNSGSHTVSVIDPATYRVIDSYPVARVPHHVTPSWDMQTLFVDNTEGNTLTPIDPRTGKKAGPDIPVADPYNLYFTLDGREAIVVAEREQTLYFRNPNTWAINATLFIPYRGVDHADFTADGRFGIFSCEFSGYIVKVDMVEKKIVAALNVGREPIDVKTSPDGSVVYVANQGHGGVHVIDPITMQQIEFIPTGAGAHGLYPSRDTKKLYVSNRLGGTVTVIDFTTRKVEGNWEVGGSPDMGGVSTDGTKLWLSSRFDTGVLVIDTTTGKLIGKVQTGAAPHGLVIHPQPGRYSTGHTGVYR